MINLEGLTDEEIGALAKKADTLFETIIHQPTPKFVGEIADIRNQYFGAINRGRIDKVPLPIRIINAYESMRVFIQNYYPDKPQYKLPGLQ